MPSMNFFPASLIGEGADVTTGIRPEDLFLSDEGPVTADVTHVEHLGGDTNVIAHANQHQIIARLFGQHQVSEGEDLRLGFAPESTYAFDPDGVRVG